MPDADQFAAYALGAPPAYSALLLNAEIQDFTLPAIGLGL